MSGMTMAPDADLAQAGLVLHVVRGPNAGAELKLENGTWLIGTGAAADLTFADPDLAEEHLRITVAGTGITIEALAGAVRTEDRALAAGDSESLDLLRPVWVGRTAFAVGPSGSDWPDAAIRPAPAAATAAAPTPPPAAAAGLAAPPRKPATAARPKARRYIWCGAAAGCVLLVILLGAWIIDMTTEASPLAKPVALADPLQPVQAAIHGLGLQDVVTAAVSSNGMTVTGLVPTAKDQASLAQAVRRVDPTIALNVITETWLRDMIGTVLRGYAVEASMTVQPDGRIQLSGYAPTAAAADAAARQLRQDIPWIRALDYAVVTPDGAQADLDAALHGQGLSSLKVISAPHLVTVSGTVPAGRLEAWNAIQAAFKQRYGDRVALATRLMPLAAAAPLGVSLGQQPYLIMDGGKRLGIGDMLGSLGRITMIFSDRLRVRTAHGDVDMPYTQPPHWILKDNNAPAR